MIFEKEAIMIQEEAENRPSGDRDGAPRNALYARKQVFVQASHAEQSWQVPFTPKDSFAAAAQESARAWQTFGNKPTLP